MPEKPTILIVDDNAGGREVLRGVLSARGYNLLLAESGLDALAQVKEHSPDLVLLDVMMPGINGFEVCRRLRFDPVSADLPVVMITTLDDKESRVRGLEAGADGFISKPFDRTELRARVKTIVRLNRYRRLAAERAKVDQLVSFSPDGIVVVNAMGEIRLANTTIAHMLGFEQTHMVGMWLWTLIGPKNISEYTQAFARVMRQEGSSQLVEVELLRSDAALVPVEISAAYCVWGEHPSAQLVIRDITSRRSLEAQLRQSQRIESIGQLTSGIAHDFNNILTVVMVNADLVATSLPPKDRHGAADLDDIMTAAQSGADMVQKLMGMGRKADLRMEPADLGPVINNLSSILRSLLPDDIEMEVALESPVPTVHADAGAVEQMVINLATNARDAMPDGGTFRIEVGEATWEHERSRPKEVNGSGPYLCITASDTGLGMDAETKARVFEPLFTTKGPGKGSGLGMAMIAGLIEQHNGFVEVQSEVGAGTTIRLYFPAVDTTPRPRPMPISIAEVPSGAEMILVAEDNGPLRRAARLALKKFGYTVLLAPNGEEALSLFRANKESIVLVVSDMVMPKMNGIQLYRAIRKESKGVKFLFSSGYAADDIEAHASDLAAVPSLKKPWRLAELATRVREVLDEAPVA